MNDTEDKCLEQRLKKKQEDGLDGEREHYTKMKK